MSIPTPTRDLDALAAFFGDGEWTLPDESPWDGADFDARACVARLRAEVERLEARGDSHTLECDELNEIVDDADARLCESADEIARLRERVAEAEARAGALALTRDLGRPMTGPEFVDAALASGLFTPEFVDGLRAGVRRARGDPATPVADHPQCCPTSHCGADDCPGKQGDR